MSDFSADQHKILKHTLGPALATLVSRLLGLVRVMLEARVLGGSALASAWHFAFAVPNLLRRLFGEGALGTALIPLITESDLRFGRDVMRRQLAVVFAALSAVLALIIIVVTGGALIVEHGFMQPSWPLRWRLLIQLVPLLMPYGLFMCLVGVAGAVLSTRKQFFLPALGALLLNLFLIGGLGWCHFQSFTPAEVLPFLKELCWLVLASGFFQMVMMGALLGWCGCFPSFHGLARAAGILKPLWHLTLPGLIGAAALQVSFLADRAIALCIGDQAVPALVYMDRLIDLPIGIFALSLGQVLMASMSRAAAEGEFRRLSEQLSFSLRHIYFICIPMAAAVVALWRPMLSLLCRGGNYTASDLEAAKWVAVFYGAGIPFFCSTKVLLPAFYARKEMRFPLCVSLITITLNVSLNLALMHVMKQGGIALATVLSAMTGNAILLWKLQQESFSLDRKMLAVTFGRTLLLSAAAAGAAFWVLPPVSRLLGHAWLMRFFALGVALAVFGVVYGGLSLLFRAPETGEFLALVRRKKRD